MLTPGDRIDIWVIDKRLGTGGMGSVYRCHNHAAPRILAAIKVLDGPVARNREARARFVREAEILFTLDHPNIVKVRNIRADAEYPYIEMEFVEGASLEDHLSRRGRLPLEQTVHILEQLADAVAYLHSRGVRHRDIKPANILIDPSGTARLVDFGLAMEADNSRLTQGQMNFGTVSYAPPEWIEPERLDPVKWDLYALGVVAWESLTGAVAFPVSGQGDARQQAFQVVLKKQAHPPLDPGDDVPDAVRALIADLTRADPDERLSSATALVARVAELSDIGRRQPTPITARASSAAPPPPPVTSVRPRDGGADTFAIHGPATAGDIEVEPRSLPPHRSARWPLVAGVLAVLGVTALTALALGVGWLALTLGQRPVEITVTGLPDGVPFDALIDDRAPTELGPTRALFTRIRPGEHTIDWTTGAGCEALSCARGLCPDWCLHGSQTLQIPVGEGIFSTKVELAAAPGRPARIGTSDLDPALPVEIVIEGAEGRMEGRSWRSASVRPGRYQATVKVGTCPDIQPCEDDCPPGCRWVRRELTIPLGETRHEARLQVRAPRPARPAQRDRDPPSEPDEEEDPAAVPSDTPDATAPDDPSPDSGPPIDRPDPDPSEALPIEEPSPEPVPEPEPEREPEPTRTGSLITARQFASWLQENPDWMPERARQRGIADHAYLFGWQDLTPPPGEADRPVQHVPHLAARAYCQSRGGLPQVGDPPTSWNEDRVSLGHEWRMRGQTPAILESTGTPSTMVRRGQSLLGVGFRCTR